MVLRGLSSSCPISAADIRPGYGPAKRDFDRQYLLMPLFRNLSFGPTALFSGLGISANQATWISFVLGLAGIVMIANGDYAWVVAGVIFVNLWSITDYIDGNLGRYHQQSSLYGKFLDDFRGEIVAPRALARSVDLDGDGRSETASRAAAASETKLGQRPGLYTTLVGTVPALDFDSSPSRPSRSLGRSGGIGGVGGLAGCGKTPCAAFNRMVHG